MDRWRWTLARDGVAVDVITGGFPRQDISVAGKQAGLGEGTRSGLWSEIVRLIGELRPRYVIVENVANLLSGPSERPGGWFGRILGDLAECGYDAEWENIPAAAIGAPHARERIWIVAYPWQKRGQRRFPQEIQEQPSFSWCKNGRSPAHFDCRPDLPKPLFRGAGDGVPHWVDRLAALGNAVVPQIPEIIGRAILEVGC